MHNYKESTYKKVVETLAFEGGHAIFQIFENDDCVVTCGNDECMGLTTVPFRTLYRNYTLKNGVFSCPHCKRRNYLQAWADKHNALLSPDNHTVKCKLVLWDTPLSMTPLTHELNSVVNIVRVLLKAYS